MHLSSEASFGLRRSCTEVRRPTFWWFCVNPGIPPQMPQKGDYTRLVNFLRLSSIYIKGAPAGFREVFCAKPRSRGRFQAQERRKPAAVPTAVKEYRKRRPGLDRPSTIENILPQERYQPVAEIYLQCLPCATQTQTWRYWSLTAPSWPGGAWVRGGA